MNLSRLSSVAVLVAALNPVGAIAEKANLGRLNGTADYALINGKIYTMDEAQPWAEAVAIEGNKITYVGGADGLKSQIGLGTEVIDLDGRMMMPGFVDGHIHAIAGGMIMQGLDLQTDDKDELFKRLKTYIADNPDLDVILGYGFRFNVWTDGNPTAAMLDKLESERPVYLWAIDGHIAWVNSKALEIAGIDKETPDTVPGYSYFEKDENGEPTGYIVEVPAQMQVLSALVDVDLDFIKAGVEEWLPRISEAGITAVADYGIQGIGQDEGFQLFKDLEVAGQLPVRVVGVYYWNDPNVDPIPLLRALDEKHSTELIQANRLKINLDGGDDKWTGLFVEPYADRPDIEVRPIIPYDVLNDVVKRADAAGFDVVCHCFGDLAVRKLLDAIEAAIAANPERDRRNVLSHLVLVHPEDVGRFSELGVTADLQAAWGALDPLNAGITTERLGEEHMKRYIGINELLKAGANLSFSSDWPVSGYISNIFPLRTIQVAATRRTLGDSNSTRLGGDAGKVPLEAALRAHTLGAAYGMGIDDKVGSIQMGKLADLIVLDKNIFEVPEEEIGNVKVMYTIMNGKFVHETAPED